MDSRYESKVGILTMSAEKIYTFLSNFNNFSSFVPHDKVKNWEAGEDWCSFTVDLIGKAGLKMIEKVPYKLIKITADGSNEHAFYFWIQLKEILPNDTRIKLILQANLNPMMKMMIDKHIQTFLDKLVDQIATSPISYPIHYN